VADVLLYQISHFKKIVSSPFTIIPQMLKWFPIRILGIMNLATGIILVIAIIAVDLDLFEFLLQELQVSAEKLLEIGFYA
jgi:hypothetical protein